MNIYIHPKIEAYLTITYAGYFTFIPCKFHNNTRRDWDFKQDINQPWMNSHKESSHKIVELRTTWLFWAISFNATIKAKYERREIK